MALAEHSIEVHNAVQSLRELEALAGSKQHCNRPVGQSDIEHPPCKVARTSREAKPAGLRHVETEQRRRDRINEGFAALRELLPRTEKCDKATFLISAVQYIKELQGLLRELIESGALSHLDSDHQWTLRMLLPRRDKITVRPALPAPAYTPAQGQVTAPLPLSGQPAPNTDPVMMLLASLLQPQAPAPQVTEANLQLAQLLLAAQLQAPTMQSPLTLLPQGPTTGLSAGMLTLPSVLPNHGVTVQQNMTAAPVNELSPGLQAPAQAAGGCSGAPVFQVMPVFKARKVGKIRRHTSASRIEKPVLPDQAPLTGAGRPAQTELAT